ncbi:MULTISPECIES: ATP-binding cassette domain-containing protein [Mammaliicoccus]|uniref:ATP-binding cassette domain-containing protein n=1 Tax=Mammaliicoccus fleurettii TaxID=150056 RepID=A0ABS5ML18_9STAP|nr:MULTISPECIES: ATP-binding cassette domain-containing protein [Mammaliicoccus]MBL0846355.1 ATP-binding cassette domain-containing protein [Mammaliicoccus fleurettii]MBO3061719.1 ATP-binding cassette domain-containing protein [Mammaliicoccus fleurettii]MBS3671431.1 ATP-binding cassette domain-containing protein [Mammaliicoccus fleurettii]MBS3696615.1 ATP-binding cassette domain-containing protein [Mammaliicoccus fleurettii]MBW0766145.1 ATP-binding cassette domain-containing protein [Mammaliic
MIEFKNVNKVFQQKNSKIQALEDVSFKVEEQDIFGVIGYSGAGKSTLVRLVNVLEEKTSGEVIVNGHDINQYSKKELQSVKKNIGMIFQHFNLLNSKTVFNNVAMPLVLQGTNKSKIKEKVDELLKFVGLEDKGKQYPNELSGGQKQRVAIARALVTDPKILLCDEATSALDPATTDSILKLLKRVNEQFGVTILLITHEMSVIQKICNKVAVMENGKVIEIGPVLDVFSHPQTLTAKNFVSTVITTDISPNLRKLIPENQNATDIKLYIDGEQVTQSIINDLITKYHVQINVLFASMSDIQGIPVGYLTLRLNGEQKAIQNSFQYLNELNIEFEEVEA